MKQRITRKMKRELKNAVNPLEELLIIIKQYFPKNKSILMARYFETCIEITNANFLIKKSIILQIENILKVLYVRTYSSYWWS